MQGLSVQQQMVRIIAEALLSEQALIIIEALQQRPLTNVQLAEWCGCSVVDVNQSLQLLQKAGLVQVHEENVQLFSLSPFGMYGARQLMNQVLATTCEDGQCSGCCGCSEKK